MDSTSRTNSPIDFTVWYEDRYHNISPNTSLSTQLTSQHWKKEKEHVSALYRAISAQEGLLIDTTVRFNIPQFETLLAKHSITKETQGNLCSFLRNRLDQKIKNNVFLSTDCFNAKILSIVNKYIGQLGKLEEEAQQAEEALSAKPDVADKKKADEAPSVQGEDAVDAVDPAQKNKDSPVREEDAAPAQADAADPAQENKESSLQKEAAAPAQEEAAAPAQEKDSVPTPKKVETAQVKRGEARVSNTAKPGKMRILLSKIADLFKKLFLFITYPFRAIYTTIASRVTRKASAGQ
ncbi:hypothetical protein JYU14_04880 [Simkania negevensis]|uniref:Uncharacterized protein n=1 Tax=Simkania negevensis TaxID=83561 RepID=A0ABS3AS85_9BACT|nr:hypothetical protein [Simkania negevensis]